MKKSSHFIGKVCTVITTQASRFFDEQQHANTFIGIVEEIDDFGVWVLQISGKKKSFFYHHSIIGIIEETVTTFSQEEVILLKKELEKTNSKLENKGDDLISLDSLKKVKKIANKE